MEHVQTIINQYYALAETNKEFECELGIRNFIALYVLNEHGHKGLSNRLKAMGMGGNKQATYNHLNRLEEYGFMRRDPKWSITVKGLFYLTSFVGHLEHSLK